MLAHELVHVIQQRVTPPRMALKRLQGARRLLPECMSPPVHLPFDPAFAEEDDGPDPFANLDPGKRKVADLVNEIATKYGIEPRLALAVL